MSPTTECYSAYEGPRSARVWSASDGSEVAVLRGHEREILSASFSLDGARIVTASLDGTARVWSGSDGSVIAILRGHEEAVQSASFSPDGTRIVTASFDGTARVWSGSDGSEIAVLREHEGEVLSASYSLDGARIVTASVDGTARVWSASDGSEIAVLRGHERGVLSASFSPEGTRIVTASSDRTARVWDGTATFESLINWALDYTERNDPLTRREMRRLSEDGGMPEVTATEDKPASDEARHFKLYELYVATTETVTERRAAANKWMLTVNSAITGLYGYLALGKFSAPEEHHIIWLIAIPCAGAIVCLAWAAMLASYRKLNAAKFKVIHEMEKDLVFALTCPPFHPHS